jgi:hypothetical protein
MKQTILVFLLLIGFVTIFNSCQKEFSLENSVSLADAKGSLTDSLGNCLYDSVHATFYNGVTPGGDTAYVEIQVQVDSAGNYRIYTDLQNGFMFADSGFFSKTGINTIKLKPIGTPLLQTVTDFTVTFDNDTCGFAVYVQDSTGTGLGGGNNGGGTDSVGTWEFDTDNGHFYGTIDTTLIQDTLGNSYLYLLGRTAGSDSTFAIIITFPNFTITAGNYNVQDPAPAFTGFELNDPADNPIYVDITDPTSQTSGSVIVSSYDDATKIISGTFSGLANDSAGNAVINIKNGKFTATVSP